MRGAGERVGCRGLPGCSIMRDFLPFANIGVLCAAARSPCICSRLQVALGLWPKCPQGTRFPPARAWFRSLANIGVLCAGRAQPLYLLTPSGRFGTLAQQPTGLTLPSGAPKTCAAAQKESVASAQRAQETRHAPLSQKSHERPSTPHQKNRPPPHKRERAATRPAGSIRQTDSPWDTAATRAGCRRCP